MNRRDTSDDDTLVEKLWEVSDLHLYAKIDTETYRAELVTAINLATKEQLLSLAASIQQNF